MNAPAVLAVQPADVIAFWREAGPSRWFRKDESFDREFRDRFLGAHEAAAAGSLDAWTATPEGALALLLLLDQFPRNAFRGTPRVYATDDKARGIARQVVQAGCDRELDALLRPFVYLPFMHAEDLRDQELCVRLMEPLGGEHLRYAKHHRGIIERFGRFPHRNAVLGRPTMPDEQRFLEDGGFGG